MMGDDDGAPRDEAQQDGIRLSHVSRRFGRRTEAVRDLSLAVPVGTMCGLIGLNGAGKTTTIRMLVGLLAPTSGQIRVAGCDVPRERQRLKLHIGYVPDRPTVYGWMRVHQAIDFCRTMYGPERWNDTLVTELLKTLRLDERQRVKHLSKGSAAKLQLLLAIGHDPEVLILDEPTSGFDPLARDEFLEGILTVNTAAEDKGRRPRTVLFSSHGLSDVQRLADSIALMHEGRLLLHEPTDRLVASTKRIHAVLEDARPARPLAPPPGTIHQVRRGREWVITVRDFSPQQVDFVRAQNADVRQAVVSDLTLDDVFRDYVRGHRGGNEENVPEGEVAA